MTRAGRPDITSPGAVAAYWCLVIAGWSAINCLAAMGSVILLFIMMANASFEGFFREAANLSAHYLAATPSAQNSFQQSLCWLLVGLCALIAGARVRVLIASLRAPPPLPPSPVGAQAHTKASAK